MVFMFFAGSSLFSMTFLATSQPPCQSFANDWHGITIGASTSFSPLFDHPPSRYSSYMSSSPTNDSDLSDSGQGEPESGEGRTQSNLTNAGDCNDELNLHQGHAGTDDMLPPNNMGIVPVSSHMDPNLFEEIVVCAPEDFTDADWALTNDQIELLRGDAARTLCHKCQYKALSKAGTLVKKRVSTHGSVPSMTSRLLSYFQVARQQRTLGAAAEGRAFSLNTSAWLPAEDVRLLEIFLDRDYAKATDAAFIRSSRPVLDATDGSPLVSVWANIVGPLFNHFDNYRPEHRFLNDSNLILCQCDPNSRQIPRRIPGHLRSRFAALRSRWTVVYESNWKKSGQLDPETFTNFISVQSPLDVTMLWMFHALHMAGNELMLGRVARTVNQDARVDSSDMPLTMENVMRGGGEVEPHVNPIRRSQAQILHEDFKEMLDEIKEANTREAAADKSIELFSLQSNRDRALSQMQRMEDLIQLADEKRARKRYKRLYKHYKDEYMDLERKVAKHRGVAVNESLFEDDESFLSVDS